MVSFSYGTPLDEQIKIIGDLIGRGRTNSITKDVISEDLAEYQGDQLIKDFAGDAI